VTDSDLRRFANLVEVVLAQFSDIADQERRDRLVMQKIRRWLGVKDAVGKSETD
jgi:hypothetical protein